MKRLFQQRSITVFDRPQFLEKHREHPNVIGIDPRHLRDPIGIVLMVRDTVMLFGDPDLWIRALAEFTRHHEGEHACEVSLVRGRREVEHQSDMFVEGIRNSHWRVQRHRFHTIAALGLLDATFDCANVIKVVAHSRPIARTQVSLEVAGLLRYRIKNTALLLSTLETLFGSPRFPEYPFESGAWIRFHRKGRCRRA